MTYSSQTPSQLSLDIPDELQAGEDKDEEGEPLTVESTLSPIVAFGGEET